MKEKGSKIAINFIECELINVNVPLKDETF